MPVPLVMSMSRQQGPPTPNDSAEAASPDELLTVLQIAERLRVSEETVRSWLRAGELRGANLGGRAGWRVRASEVEHLLSARTPIREKNRRERDASDG